MVNKVILIGNVGADPEIRNFEDGSKVARINIATTERTFNSRTQERVERTEWHRVVLWRGLAGIVEQYVRKGSQIYIEGKIRSNEWTDANGTKRYGIEIVADVMNLLGRRDASQGQYNSGGGYQQSQPYGQQNQSYGQQSSNSQPYGGGGQPYSPPAPAPQPTAAPAGYDNMPEEEDDLPF